MLNADGPSRSGSVDEFRASWRERHEAKYNHWTRRQVRNQVQLAFRCHWEVFRDIIGQRPSGHALEVGCGRGSLSSYFVANGWQATLLDSSPEVIEIAREIFMTNGHRAEFVVGDALDLPFDDGSFDVVASIGLLEHFEKPGHALTEQWRMLKPGGWLLCYIVPERPDNIQKYFYWINRILAATIGRWANTGSPRGKPELYRSDAGSESYLPYVECHQPAHLIVTGIYSMPMISHSPQFPFSLLPGPMERALVAIFQVALSVRRFLTGRHGWLCEERNGQAFLIAARRA